MSGAELMGVPALFGSVGPVAVGSRHQPHANDLVSPTALNTGHVGQCLIIWTNMARLSNIYGMAKRSQPAFPAARRRAAALGQRLRDARLRRRMSATVMAERAGVSRDTLHRLEKGDVSISLAGFLRVLEVLGLADDVDAVAKDDVLGRKLQDMNQVGPRPRRRARGEGDG